MTECIIFVTVWLALFIICGEDNRRLGCIRPELFFRQRAAHGLFKGFGVNAEHGAALARQLRDISGVALQRLVLALGVLVGDAL